MIKHRNAANDTEYKRTFSHFLITHFDKTDCCFTFDILSTIMTTTFNQGNMLKGGVSL